MQTPSVRRAFGVATLVISGLGACGSTGPSSGPAVTSVSLTLNPQRPFYPVHDQIRVSAVAVLEDGTSYPVGLAGWQSLDPTLASVTADGLIEILAPGAATIEAHVGSHTAQVHLVIRGLLHKGSITQSETWAVADTPHVVQQVVSVDGAGSAVLTIEPGVRVLFRPLAGLALGGSGPNTSRLVTSPGGPGVVFEGDSAVAGSWTGISFTGPTHSDLRHVTLRHCGGLSATGIQTACLISDQDGFMQGPTLFVEDVTVIGAPVSGMMLSNFTAFDPRSRNLNILNGAGHIATISPVLAGQFPPGGQFTGNADNTIWIGTGLVTDSTTWVDPGVALRLVGGVSVAGPSLPYLTIPAGLHLIADPTAAMSFGDNGHGGLVVGDAAGPVTTIDASGAGWSGFYLADGALPSSLTNVDLNRCGMSAGACILLSGQSGAGTRLHVENLRILDAPWVGMRLTGLARFDSTSTNLTITNAGDVPVEMWPDAVPSLPAGNYRSNGRNVINLPFGPVTQSASWPNIGIPYFLQRGLSINDPTNNPVLILQPGVVLQSAAGTVIGLGNGALQAIGTVAEPVIFASYNPGTAGGWMGIDLGGFADSRTRFDHVEIQDAGGGQQGVGGAVRMQADPGGLFRNTTFTRSETCGVMLWQGPWTDDYSDPLLGNAFVALAGPGLCQYAP